MNELVKQARTGVQWWGVALLVATVALLYGHTLDVPMYLDDHGALLGNSMLRDLPATAGHFFSQRGLTNLTFALNYRLTGWALPPLHLTNIALHLLCGILAWRLLLQLLPGRILPLLGALLFLAHPLQTQAVTYLVQRSAVLATMFFLAAVLCHRQARGRLAAGEGRLARGWLAWQAGAVFCGACAVLAKESTATLPLLLMVHDALFPLPQRRTRRQWLADYLPFFAVPLLLGGPLLFSLLQGGTIPRTASALVAQQHNDPLHYLVTQFSVLWVYLRLLLLPYGQALEHGYPVVVALLAWRNALALAGLLILAGLAWRVRHRRPLLTLGVAWFFLGLAVESSIIPLDPLFEHRLYLPMTGFVLVLADTLPALLGERRGVAVLAVALVICLPLAWRRNDLWNDTLRFNEHDFQVAPESERVNLALIYDYRDAGRFADAERHARRLMAINPRFDLAYEELALLLARQGAPERALAVIAEGLRQRPDSPRLYQTSAKVRLQAGDAPAALQTLRDGVAAAPQSVAMHDQLAALLFEVGDHAEAEAVYRRSLAINGASAATRRNLARVLYSTGRMSEALEQLLLALQAAPWDPDSLEGYGKTAVAIGNLEAARQAAGRLRHNDPQRYRELQAEIDRVAGGGR